MWRLWRSHRGSATQNPEFLSNLQSFHASPDFLPVPCQFATQISALDHSGNSSCPKLSSRYGKNPEIVQVPPPGRLTSLVHALDEQLDEPLDEPLNEA